MLKPPSSTSAIMPAAARQRSPTHAVTLFNKTGWPLFQWVGRCDPVTALELASGAYRRCMVEIGKQRVLGDDAQALSPNPAQTMIAPARGRESWRINYFPRCSGELAAREARPVGVIGRVGTVDLLQEVVFGDARLRRALVSGATIELCPFHEWSSKSGWVTIDCAFRAHRDGRPARDLRPHSPHLRDAVRLVVLQALLRFLPSRRQALVERWSVGTVAAHSATVRAMLRSRGTVRPARLIGWLRSHGANELADALHGGATR